MSGRRRWAFILSSVTIWGLLGFTLLSLLQTLETGCKLQERQSGLWAECAAPAVVIYSALFAAIFLIDVVRTVSVLWPSKPDKE